MAYCSDNCRDQYDPDRFWAKVDRSAGPLACWPWLGSCDPKGYGWFSVGKTMRHAHRVALELHLGRRLTPTEYALHTCDNPPCCNVHPDHVHQGTALDNCAEMYARGRDAKARGTANAATKLTGTQVREIRAVRAEWLAAHPGRVRVERGSPISTGVLAAKYGVSTATITAVVKQRTHKDRTALMKQLSLFAPGDNTEILPANTHPLPYIQVGMRLKLRKGGTKFTVTSIDEVEVTTRALCIWVGGKQTSEDCLYLREQAWLAEAFDPSCAASEARR